MNSKPFVFIGMIIGSSIGGLIPMLWGDNAFSMTSIFLSSIGAIAGIYFGFKFSQRF